MQVIHRPGLEKASCECYVVVKKQFDDFLTPPPLAVQENSNGGNSKGRGAFIVPGLRHKTKQ